MSVYAAISLPAPIMLGHFFIGVDGGATSCHARIRDMDGNLLGEGCSGPANIQLDFDLARESISAASKEALRAAGSMSERFTVHTPAWAWQARA